MSGLSPQPPDALAKAIYTPLDPNADFPQGEILYEKSRTIRSILVDLKIYRLDENDLEDLHRIRYHAQSIVDWITDIKAAYRNSQEEETIEHKLADDGPTPETETPDIPTPPSPPKAHEHAPAAAEQPQITATQHQQPADEDRPFTLVTNPRRKRRQPHPKHQYFRRPSLSSKQPSTRLIVRIPGQTIPPDARPHPAVFRDELNTALHMPAVDSVQYTRSGQLALHTRAPYTAAQLALLSSQIWPAIRAALRIESTLSCPVFEPNEAWTSIVIHGVPIPIWDGKADQETTHKAIVDEICTANGLLSQSI